MKIKASAWPLLLEEKCPCTTWLCYGETKIYSTDGNNGLAGAFGGKATPVPMPNTAVKLASGDDTGNPGKVAQCRINEKDSSCRGLF